MPTSDPDLPFVLYRQSDGEWFQFDNCYEEQHAPTMTATVHPIESGAPVTDHVQRNPDRVDLRVEVTESPFASDVRGTISGHERIQAAIRFLEACVGEALTFDVTRTEARYDMVLIGFPHPVNVVRRVIFGLSFQSVRFAEAANVTIPAAQPVAAVATGAADTYHAGQQACTAVSSDTDSDARAPADPFVASDQSAAYEIAHAADPIRFP